jgi:hypothetical protein
VGKAVEISLAKETGIIVNVFTHFFATTRQLKHKSMDSYSVLQVFGEFPLRYAAPVCRENFNLLLERNTEA